MFIYKPYGETQSPILILLLVEKRVPNKSTEIARIGAEHISE